MSEENTVINPVTGRPIRLFGTVFRRLVGGSGSYIYLPGDNRLALRPLVRVTHIRNPSSGEIEARNHVELVTTGAQYEAVLASLEDGFADENLIRDPWYREHAYRVEIEFEGEIVVFEEDEDAVVEQQPALNPVLANNPLRLPFANVALNEGDDDKCVERWLGIPMPPRPDIDTILANVDATPNLECIIYDIFGGVMHHSAGIARDNHPKAVLYQGHIYPVTRDQVPRLIDRPVIEYPIGHNADVYDKIKEANAMLFRVDDTFYVGGVGVFNPKEATTQEQREFAKCFSCHMAWDPAMMQIFKDAALPMFLPLAEGVVRDPDRFCAVDMKKCYYNVMQALMDPRVAWQIFEPDPFVRPEPYDGTKHADLGYLDWVVIKEEDARMLHGLIGLNSNLLCYVLWREVNNLARVIPGLGFCTPVEVIRFRRAIKIPSKARDIMDRWEIDPQAQKEFALVNGLMGRTGTVIRRDFQLGHEFTAERAYYTQRPRNFAAMGEMMMLRKESLWVRNNKLNVHASVIQHASAMVVRAIGAVRHQLKIFPVRVKTDSLTYSRNGLARTCLLNGFGSSGDCSRHILSVINSDCQDTPYFGWRPEPVKLPPADFSHRLNLFQMTDSHPYVQQYRARNITHIGPPGSGKTTSVLQLRDRAGEKPDFIATLTNRNARRIGGVTIHALLGIGFGPEQISRHMAVMLDRLRDKRIFIDEAQSVPRWIWSHFIHLFHAYNVSFTFAMDPEQLAPIDDDDAPIDLVPFHGAVVYHNVDWRNGSELIRARDQVLSGLFIAPTSAPIFDPTCRHAHWNIAAYHRTCDWVNAKYVAAFNLTWGGPGRYIVDFDRAKVCLRDPISRRKRKIPRELAQSTMFEMTEDYKFVNMDTGDELPYAFDFISPLLKWAWCVTVDKTIGSTIKDPFTIWDVGCPWWMQRHGMFYTALTRGVLFEDIKFKTRPDYDE